METGGGKYEIERQTGEMKIQRERDRRRRTRDEEEEPPFAAGISPCTFVIAGAYAGINVTNFDDLHAHRNAPSVSFCLGAAVGHFSPIERERSA